jgi:carboxypeptidase PM20D1
LPLLISSQTFVVNHWIAGIFGKAGTMSDEKKLQIFSEILRFKTVSHQPGEPFDLKPFRELADYLQKTFPLVHSRFTREVVGGGSLLFTLPGEVEKLKPVMLTAHLDVVPAGDSEAWPEPPYSGRISGGRVWGRGSIDYKAGVSAMLQACEELLESGFRPERSLILSFGHDEEVGGDKGATEIVRILKNRGVSLSSVLDEGGYIYSYPWLECDVAVLGLAEKGYLTLRLKAKGDQGHASVPGTQTAAGRLCSCLAELESNQMKAKLCEPVEMMLNSTSGLFNPSLFSNDSVPGPDELMQIVQQWPSGNALVRTTTAITIIRGSNKENVIPGEPCALVNFRAVPGDHSSDIVEHVRRIAGPLGVDVSYEDTNHIHEPSEISSTETIEYSVLEDVIRSVWPGMPVVPGIFPAATDSRHYCSIAENVYRFQPVHLGQKGLGTLHSTGESISVQDYLNAIDFYSGYISRITGS